MRLLQMIQLLVVTLILSSCQYVLAQSNGVATYESCSSAKTCTECLIRSPDCAWCKSPEYDDTENLPRCDSSSNLMSRGCADEDIVSPQNEKETIKDTSLTEVGDTAPTGEDLVQVKPQEINLKMRPGQTEQITLQIRQAEDFPVDLYYLMDLSDSMSDDLVSIRRLGDVIASEMKNITSNFQLGYGAFVDKKEVPYVEITPERLANPCGPSGTCEPPFGFLNVLSLTEQTHRFSEEVGLVQSSGNLDNPEGGLDALMQATVCTNEIGWRDRARHLLLFSTDSPFHIAGDGKLGGIIKPNDGRCHINSDGRYTMSTTLDYPSISQLSSHLKEKSILPVFAIGKATAEAADPFIYYDKLRDYFHESYAERLEGDSSNIVDVIKNVYESITSGVKVEDNAQPEFFDVNYTAICNKSNPGIPGSSECNEMRLGDDVEFVVNLTMKNTTCDGDKRSFKIEVGPTAYAEDLVINVEAICDCACSSEAEISAEECNDNGTLICGGCICNEGRSGRNCECDRAAAEGIDPDCVAIKNSSEPIECSGRGTCVCGLCVCDTRPNPNENIMGPFCQCDDFSCDRSFGALCGGPTRGQCLCDKTTWESRCKCNDGYEGDACECNTSLEPCRSPDGLICSGVGNCTCGKCTCFEPEKHSGATCQLCKGCLGKCDELQPCVRCKGFNTGPYNQTDEEKAENDLCLEECKPHIYKIVEELTDPLREDQSSCIFKDDADDCTIRFTHEYLSNGTLYIEIQEEKECPGTPDILWVILGIILGIIFVGLALLLIWRLLTFIRDRRDFLLFEKERANAQWEAGENPIYRPSTTVHKNPLYQK